MAQPRSAASSLSLPRVLVIAPAHLGETAVAALAARGIEALRSETPGDEIIAWALDAPPAPAAAAELAASCARAAAAGRPVCLLVPAGDGGRGRVAIEHAAALAFLRAHGAAVSHDVDAWLEAVVALVRFGLPRGPRTAIVAPPGSWLEAQANAFIDEAQLTGARVPHVGSARVHASRRDDGPTHVVLYDPALDHPVASHDGAPLHIPVVPRAELGDGSPALYGTRAALAAIEMLGRAAERIVVGLGPAPIEASSELGMDLAQRDNRLARLAGMLRVGDHETKTLLNSYGVLHTRQIVALTPSAAVAGAHKLGFPVELKPWGPDVATEPEGCPVERGIASDALVRRAYGAVLNAAGRSPLPGETGPVIVRETPPSGREVSVAFVELPALGWTCIVDAPGAPTLAAGPVPLRLADAEALAAVVVASRANDPDLDRAGLANLVRRASHLVADLGTARLNRLELPRVVVGGRGARTVVIDAWCELVG